VYTKITEAQTANDKLAEYFWIGRMSYIMLIFDPVENTYFPPPSPASPK
jgi:hypothetical protein